MERKTATGFWGWEISKAIAKCIEDAKSGPLQMEFNGVTVYIDHDSNADLLHRDWNRALSGYIKGPIGPHPSASLTLSEMASDAIIERGNELRRQETDRKWREQRARERAEHDAMMAVAPAMERDEVEWQKCIEAQKGDGYGLAVYGFAEAWARLMQAKMAEGKPLSEIADQCSSLADNGYGITGFMYGCAVSVLATCWKHGEELRRWHNLKTQIRDEGEQANESGGVLNPALLSVG